MLTLRGGLLLAVAAPLWAADWPWLTAVYLLLCAAVLAADFWRAGPIGRFELSRTHDDKLSLGAENPIHLTVRQRGRQPRRIWVRDEPPEAFVISQRIHEGWVAGQQSWQATYTLRPLRRGDYAFGDLHLRWLGPLGLLVRQAAVPAAHPVKVYPNLYEVRRYDLLLRQNRLQELGLRHTRLYGQGSEFERLREYQPDDDFRRINWKATARRHRPMTVEYQTERSQNIMAVLDIGRMMQSPVADMAKLDYTINAVLLLGYVATGMGDKVGLMTFADEVVNFLSPAQGKKQFYKMLEMLYRIAPEPVEPHYGRALSYLGTKQRKRTLMLIFTDLSGGNSMDELLRHTVRLARHSLPVVVTISDPDVGAVAGQRPQDSLGVYQQTAAQQLLDERRIALETLERQGVLTLDVPANQLSIAVINRYLELKGQMRL